MKQQIITGLKKKLLLVDDPIYVIENLGYGGLTGINDYLMNDGSVITCKPINLPFHGYKIIGKLTDIPEYQFKEWVHWMTIRAGSTRYKDYYSICNQFNLTAKESFLSKLESVGIVFENKLGEYPTKQNTGLEYGMEYISKVASWEEVQEGVWDKDRTWCFEIIS